LQAFAGLTSLKELSLQRNHRLISIDPMAFKVSLLNNIFLPFHWLILQGDSTTSTNDSNPAIIRLSDNALTSIDEDLLSWKDLEYLDLLRNPWICDCNLQWVAQFREQNPAEAAILIDPDFK
jgi:hypothetical protein